jgi:hypothetical protein
LLQVIVWNVEHSEARSTCTRTRPIRDDPDPVNRLNAPIMPSLAAPKV